MGAACIAVLLVLALFARPAAADRDFYKILGVSRDVNTRQLKKAYRKLSLQYHPDKQINLSDEEAKAANQKFMEIAEAYEVLSDKEKRRTYDVSGEEGLKKSSQQQQRPDPFSMFRRFGGQQQQGPKRRPDVRIPLRVSVRDLYNGATKRFVYDKMVVCRHCRGSGAESPGDIHKCSACQGRGHTVRRQRMGPFVQQVQVPCNRCGGKGRTVGKQCHRCHGAKVEQGSTEHELVIERGAPDGTEIVFEHAADETPEEAAGHLVFVITTLPDEQFVRHGNDLHLAHTITLREALVGFSHEITHLDGHKVTLARSGVTKPDAVVELSEEGMPVHNFPTEKGKLRVTFTVEFPQELTPEQKEGFRKILK